MHTTKVHTKSFHIAKWCLRATMLLALLPFSLKSEAQEFKPLYWLGITSNWHDLNNWRTSHGIHELPTDEHLVIFSRSNYSTRINGAVPEVVLTKPVQVAGLIVADTSHLLFSARHKGILRVSNTLWLSQNTVLSKNLNIEIGNSTGSSTSFSFPERHSKNIIPLNEAAQSNLEPVLTEAPRSSCSFFTIVEEVTRPSCNGQDDGIAGVEEPLDGVGPYTYQWVGGPNTRLWPGVSAGTYTVIVFDLGQGLPCSRDVFVNEPGPLTVFNMNGTPPTCFGECNGGATPIVIGGNGGYTLSWSSGEVGPVASALCSTFTLNIEDALGCTFSTDFTFPDSPDPITFTADVNAVLCNSDDNGSIDLSISGGVGAYDVSWSGPNGFAAATTSLSNLQPGTYNLTVTDANSCLATDSYTIGEPLPLTATAAVTPNLCPGANAGEIAVSPSGGTAPYSFAWTGPDGFSASAGTIDNLFSGSYNLTLTDFNGCIYTETFEVTAPAPILISSTVNNVQCFGENSGSISTTASGGTGPYGFLWSGPDGFSATGADIVNLLAGAYQLTITDANACSTVESFDITEPDELTADLLAQQLSCVGNGDGTIASTISGGVLPYTFSWSGPSSFSSSDENLSGLQPGIYNLNLTDGNGCIINASIEVPNAQPITITGTANSTSCTGGNDGSIDIEITGGSMPFNFAWTGPAGLASADQNISGLAAGNYSVLLTDDEGCTANASFEVTSPTPLGATFDITPNPCAGGSLGAIATTPSGGTAPYNYLWIGPAGFFSTDQNINGLLSGTYTLQLSDANGCSGFIEAIVTQGTPINITRVLSQVTCFGGSNGSINITVSGGTAPYSYSWSGPDGFVNNNQNLTNIAAGTYTVLVTDANGCEGQRTYNITQPNEIIIDGSVSNVTCAGDNDGAIATSVVSGAGPFTFSWSGPAGFTASTAAISNLIAGAYTITATNSQGCQGSTNFEVDESSAIEVTANIVNLDCFGDDDGSISLLVNGGAEPYTIAWSGPNGFTSNETVLNGLAAGSYELNLTDDFGCGFTEIYVVSSPDAISISLDAVDISCAGEADGSIDGTVVGGLAPYSFAWSGPAGYSASDLDISGLFAGVYSLQVTDANGCLATSEATIAEPENLSVSIAAIEPDCQNDDGQLTAIPVGGTAAVDYNYSWSDESAAEIGTTPTIDNLGPGTYNVLVTDDNGCIAQATVELARDGINLSAALSNTSCPDSNDGQINVNPQTGTPPFNFAWTGPAGFTSDQSSINGLSPGTYFLQVNDAAGCELLVDYEIGAPAPLSIGTNITPESCEGSANGQVALSPVGGTPPYSFDWQGPDGFTFGGTLATGLQAGTYLIAMADANNCQTNIEAEVPVDLEIVIELTGTSPLCFGEPTGTLEANIIGGAAPYSYTWTGPDLFESSLPSIDGLLAGDYSLTISDANGCPASGDASLTNPSAIEVDVTTGQSSCLEANGSATGTATGGTGILSFEWFNEGGDLLSTSSALENVTAGIYTLTVTDASGCMTETLAAISDATGNVGGAASPTSCAGGSDGSIAIEITDGAEPFEFNWTGPGGFTATTQNIDFLVAGTYGVVVTDANGCSYASEFEVTSPTALGAELSVTNATCVANNGAAALTATGGTPPYTFSWSGPEGFSADAASIVNLIVGTYTYVISDANACATNGAVNIEIVPDIVATSTISDASCGDANTGSIALTVSGGNAPYTFGWSGPDGFTSTEQNIESLAGGQYDLTITDSDGCAQAFSFSITQPDPLNVELLPTHPDCATANGSITANISGGLALNGYTLLWTDGEGNNLGSDNPIQNLGTGTYTLLASDDNGCTTSNSITLTNPGIEVIPDVFPITCPDAEDGIVVLSIIADNPPIEVNWFDSNGFISNNLGISGLAPGTYTYEATASDGCTASGSFTFTNPEPIGATATVTPPCFGESNGSAALEISNGAPPYTVNWSDSDGNVIASGELVETFAPGTYNYTIIDDNACVGLGAVTIDEGTEIIISLSANDVQCGGVNDASILTSVTGGVEGYTAFWEGPDAFESDELSPENLGPGTYHLTITDAIGCLAETQIVISAPDTLMATIAVEEVTCENIAGPYGISLSANGGTAPYAVLWTGPNGFSSDVFSISAAVSGIYSYVLNDAQGCSIEGETEVAIGEPLGFASAVSAPNCFGQSDGSISIELFGGLGPVQVAWLGPGNFTADTVFIDNLMAGTYSLTLTDSLGCTLEDLIEVLNPPALSSGIGSVSDASCNISTDGSAELNITGGTPPYQVSWAGDNGFTASGSSIDKLAPGQYFATINDANGCGATAEVTIDFILELTADAGSDIAYCFADGQVLLIGSSESADVFNWSDEEGAILSASTEATFVPEGPGTYTLIFTAGNGICSLSDSVEVTAFASPDLDAGEDLEVFAEEIFILGGSPTSQTATAFAWTPGAMGGFDANAANPSGFLLESTTFYLTVTDNNGCTAIDSVDVVVLPALAPSSGFTPNDDGVNDRWIIDNIEQFPNSIVSIFNRWGMLLYQQVAYNSGNAWDGTYEGKALPIGTYYYAIELNDERYPEPFTGPITIYR